MTYPPQSEDNSPVVEHRSAGAFGSSFKTEVNVTLPKDIQNPKLISAQQVQRYAVTVCTNTCTLLVCFVAELTNSPLIVLLVVLTIIAAASGYVWWQTSLSERLDQPPKATPSRLIT